jgi:protein-tyrosine-phosphatase
MTVHFVCKGNTFRSRLAEAYLNSKQIPNLRVISSGIEAKMNDCGPITWVAQRIIQNNHLIPFQKPVWDQTTKVWLEEGDLTIFMHQNIYDYAVLHFDFNGKNFQIWEIPDIRIHLLTLAQEFEKIKGTEKIYAEIKQKVDALIKGLI